MLLSGDKRTKEVFAAAEPVMVAEGAVLSADTTAPPLGILAIRPFWVVTKEGVCCCAVDEIC